MCWVHVQPCDERDTHMPLSRKETNDLIRMISLTEDTEINCEQCLAVVAEFTERHVAGESTLEGLRAITQHLSICEECRDEYESLKRVLSARR